MAGAGVVTGQVRQWSQAAAAVRARVEESTEAEAGAGLHLPCRSNMLLVTNLSCSGPGPVLLRHVLVPGSFPM